jgi:hypothetical protein
VAGALRVLAVAAVAGWLSYVVSAQVFLWTPLLRRIVNAESPVIHLEYRRASSVWPGRVHVEGLRLTSQDRAVQWQLDIDRVTTTIALHQLPRRIFHATGVRAQGVAFALRRRIPKPKLTADVLEGLAPVAGFPAAPIAEEGPDDELPDWRYRLFTVWLEDVAAGGVRSVWVDRTRLEGDVQIGGAFYLKPIRRVLIAPAELSGESLLLSQAGSRVAEQLRGRVKLSMGPFDPRGAKRETILHALDLEADGAGHLAGLAFLSKAVGFPLHGGGGPLRVQLRVERGVVQPGSKAAAEVADAAARAGGLEASLRLLSASFEVPEGRRARLRLDARDASVGPRDGAAARVLLTRLELEGDAPDLGSPRPPHLATVDVRGGRVTDARRLAAAVGFVAGRVDGGHGAFALHLGGPPSRLSGWVRASLATVRARIRGTALQADISVDASVRDLDPWRGGNVSGTQVRIDDARLVDRGEEDAAPGWWARIIATHARLRLGGRALIDGDMVARCRDARPIVGLYVRRADLPGFVSGLFSMDRLSVRGSVALAKDVFALRDLVAAGEGASIRATYLAAGGRSDGAALLTVGGIPIGVGLGEANGGIHLFGPGDWFSEQQGRLQAEVGTPAQAAGARRAAALRRRPARSGPKRTR